MLFDSSLFLICSHINDNLAIISFYSINNNIFLYNFYLSNKLSFLFFANIVNNPPMIIKVPVSH